MNAALDSLAAALALGVVIPWIVVSIPVGAALAYRRGWRPGLGALCGAVPVLGWAVIVAFTSESVRQAGAEVGHRLERQSSSDGDHEVSGW